MDPTGRHVEGETDGKDDEPVAVLGIGAMGHGMAASALRAGISVIVWDVHLALQAAGDTGSPSWPAWPTNGNRPSIKGSVSKT